MKILLLSLLLAAVTIPVPLKVETNRWQYPGYAIVAWDKSPETDIAGYRVYWGTNSRAYSASTNVAIGSFIARFSPGHPGAIVRNLKIGTKYFFAVTAYATNGLESDYSSEVFYTFILKTNTTLTISALLGPVGGIGPFSVKTNIVRQAAPVGGMFYRAKWESNLVSIQQGVKYNGLIWSNVLTFPSTNKVWMLSITRSNW